MNNNTDTCARVCHSPTGYGLGQTFGTSAGTQDFDSVMHTDVVVVIGANPTDGHPVFASRLKKRLRQGAKLIVIDPRRIDLVKSAHIEAAHHLPLRPGTNVAVRHRDGPCDRDRGALRRGLHPRALRLGRVPGIRRVRLGRAHSPEMTEMLTGVPAERCARPRGSMPPAATARSTTGSA
jgi:formate dehydrogenase major subunit